MTAVSAAILVPGRLERPDERQNEPESTSIPVDVFTLKHRLHGFEQPVRRSISVEYDGVDLVQVDRQAASAVSAEFNEAFQGIRPARIVRPVLGFGHECQRPVLASRSHTSGYDNPESTHAGPRFSRSGVGAGRQSPMITRRGYRLRAPSVAGSKSLDAHRYIKDWTQWLK